jgi:hypothetical protein
MKSLISICFGLVLLAVSYAHAAVPASYAAPATSAACFVKATTKIIINRNAISYVRIYNENLAGSSVTVMFVDFSGHSMGTVNFPRYYDANSWLTNIFFGVPCLNAQ